MNIVAIDGTHLGAIDGVILSGGLSSRMLATPQVGAILASESLRMDQTGRQSVGDRAGVRPAVSAASHDKAWATLDGVPLVEHAAHALAPQVGKLFISVNRDPDAYRYLGVPVADFPDPLTGRIGESGPLAGVLAAMYASAAPWLAVAPCDCPYLPPGWVAKLYAAAQSSDSGIAVVSHAGAWQPVCMLVRCGLRDSLANALAHGVRKVGQWQRQEGAIGVSFDEVPAQAFFNINTPIDLARANGEVGPDPRS